MDLEERLHTLEVNFGSYFTPTIIYRALITCFKLMIQIRRKCCECQSHPLHLLLHLPHLQSPSLPPYLDLSNPGEGGHQSRIKILQAWPQVGLRESKQQINQSKCGVLRSGSSFDDATQHQFQSAHRHQQSDPSILCNNFQPDKTAHTAKLDEGIYQNKKQDTVLNNCLQKQSQPA